MKRFNYFKYWYMDFLRYLNAKTHRSKVRYKNKKRHTEDNSPKYRMVGKMISHPELDSVAINVDNRLRNLCAIVCVGENSSLLGERASVRVKRVTHAREGQNMS